MASVGRTQRQDRPTQDTIQHPISAVLLWCRRSSTSTTLIKTLCSRSRADNSVRLSLSTESTVASSLPAAPTKNYNMQITTLIQRGAKLERPLESFGLNRHMRRCRSFEPCADRGERIDPIVGMVPVPHCLEGVSP
jgi:hypothetical protein